VAAYALTIGGRAAATPGTFDVLNPADGSVITACPLGTTALVDAAVESARGALRTWSSASSAPESASSSTSTG
jgi:aldehyde dehydrogenase (NAD+)